MTNRNVCQEAIDLIIDFEKLHEVRSDGLVYAYHDAVGYPTIGIGHLLSKVKYEDLSNYDPITQEQAHELHHQDLNTFAEGVSELVNVEISDLSFGALVSLAFNIGLGNLSKSTLIRKLNAGVDITEVAEQFLVWNKSGGKVLNGLIRRRVSEKEMFLA